jgi:hypothetical protein
MERVDLTRAETAALARIRDKGPSAAYPGRYCRSSTVRMFKRLVDRGLCTPGPHTITDAGREALASK